MPNNPHIMGVCFFDESSPGSTSNGGLFSVGGGKAEKFSDPSDLDSSVIWISNVGLRERSKLAGRLNFKQEDYLSLRIQQIGYDLGLQKQSGSVEQILPTLSLIVSQTNQVIWRAFPGMDYRPEFALREAISKKLYGREFEDLSGYTPDFRGLVKNAIQRSTRCGNAYKTAPNRFNVRKNMLIHAIEVMDTPVPSGGWQHHDVSAFGGVEKATENLLNWDRFFIAKVRVHTGNHPLSPIVGFGRVITTTPNSVTRAFVSNYELAVLASFFRVEVEDVRHAESYSPMRPEYQIADFLQSDPLAKFSYSNQLAAHIHLNAALTGRRTRPRGEQVPEMEDSLLNMVLVSRDRALTFLMAAELAKHNFAVSSYRAGYALVDCDGERSEELSDLIDKNGWSFPIRGHLSRFQRDAESLRGAA